MAIKSSSTSTWESFCSWTANAHLPVKEESIGCPDSDSSYTTVCLKGRSDRARSTQNLGMREAGDGGTTSILGSVLAGSLRVASLNFMPGRDVCVALPPGQDMTETDPVRKVTLSLFSSLAHLNGDALDSGARLDTAAAVIDRYLSDDSEVARDALLRVLHCSSDSIADEARAAMVRYLALPNVNLPLSWRTSIFVSLLNSDCEEQSIAAALSLEEIGDWGVIPALKSAVSIAQSERMKWHLREAVELIENVHGSYSNSASRDSI